MVVRFTFLIVIFLYSCSIAQIAVTNAVPFNTEESIVDVLVDGDLTVSNFSSVGFAQGIGYFDGFNSNIGFDEGVILSTGGIEFVTAGFGGGSGISGDSDLELALNAINLNWNVNNVTILEFDFVAESESVAFNYVFGSSEYSNYTCTQYNDIFGFFLSGPGITGPYSNNGVNLAYIPDPNNPGEYTTTPVAVNTVNSGSPTGGGTAATCDDIDPNWQDYSVYWIDNASMPTVSGINGFTQPFIAEYNGLECGETYHIKLAIADASDGALNSVVFLEAASFTSPVVIVEPFPNIDGPALFGDSLALYEGCAAAQLEFTAPGVLEYDVVLEVETSGACEYGVDFEITYDDGSPLGECLNDDNVLVPCITMAAGVEQLAINIQAFNDGITEGFEDLLFVLNALDGVCQQAELSVSEINFNLYDQIPIIVDPGPDEVIECFGDEAILEPESISGGYISDSNSYTYEWYDEDGTQIGTGASVSVNPEFDSGYQLVVYDDCGDQAVISDFNVQVMQYSDIVVEPTSYLACFGDIITVTTNPSGGSGDYSYVWPGDTEPCDCTSFDFLFEEGGESSVFYDVIDNCTSESYTQEIPIELQDTEAPSIVIDIIGNQFCAGDELSLVSQASGESTYTYNWLDLESDESASNELATISPEFNTLYTVEVIDDCNNLSWTQTIQVDIPVYSPPTFDLPDLEGCEGDIVQIAPQNLIAEGVQSQDDFTYLWSTGETSPVIDVEVQEEVSQYTLIVTDLCGNVGEFNIDGDIPTSNVVLSQPPAPMFTYDQDGNNVQFVQLTSGLFTSFEWDFDSDGIIDSYDENPTYSYETEGDFSVVLTAYDDADCENSYNAIVNVYASLLFYAPDIFTPNGDSHNDEFKVSIVGHKSDEFELIIYDRWGKQLFYTIDPNQGWDGKYENGTDVPQDVYMYKASMVKELGSDKTIKRGKISIVK